MLIKQIGVSKGTSVYYDEASLRGMRRLSVISVWSGGEPAKSAGKWRVPRHAQKVSSSKIEFLFVSSHASYQSLLRLRDRRFLCGTQNTMSRAPAFPAHHHRGRHAYASGSLARPKSAAWLGLFSRIPSISSMTSLVSLGMSCSALQLSSICSTLVAPRMTVLT